MRSKWSTSGRLTVLYLTVLYLTVLYLTGGVREQQGGGGGHPSGRHLRAAAHEREPHERACQVQRGGDQEDARRAPRGNFLSPFVQLVPATGIFALPFRNWFLLRVYALSPCAIDARYGYIGSPLPQLAPATGIFSPPFRDWCMLRVYSVSYSVLRCSTVCAAPLGEYTWIRDQWRVGRGNIPESGTNDVYGVGIYLRGAVEARELLRQGWVTVAQEDVR
eukprot:4200395-Pyramimonas_sp.AAC.1